MNTIKCSSPILWSTQDCAEKPFTIFFITCDNNYLYSYQLCRPAIWSYNLSTKIWTEVVKLESYLLPYPKDKIIGIVEEDKENSKVFKIFSNRNKKTRIHTCDLESREVEVENLNESLPDTAQFCQMNIFRYNEKYYTVVCVEMPNRADLLKVDVYRLNLDTWERVSNSEETSKNNIIQKSAMGIINSENKMFLFYSRNMNSIRVFDLEDNTWSWAGTSDPNEDKNLRDYDDDDPELDGNLNIFRREMNANRRDENVTMEQPPAGAYNYSMSKYYDSDTKATCLVVSASKYKSVANTPTEIWKLNLSTLQWEYIVRVGNMVNHQRVSRWAGITPNGRLVIRDGLIVYVRYGLINTPVIIHREYMYIAWTRFPEFQHN